MIQIHCHNNYLSILCFVCRRWLNYYGTVIKERPSKQPSKKEKRKRKKNVIKKNDCSETLASWRKKRCNNSNSERERERETKKKGKWLLLKWRVNRESEKLKQSRKWKKKERMKEDTKEYFWSDPYSSSSSANWFPMSWISCSSFYHFSDSILNAVENVKKCQGYAYLECPQSRLLRRSLTTKTNPNPKVSQIGSLHKNIFWYFVSVSVTRTRVGRIIFLS